MIFGLRALPRRRGAESAKATRRKRHYHGPGKPSGQYRRLHFRDLSL